jgi:hypothetical protein
MRHGSRDPRRCQPRSERGQAVTETVMTMMLFALFLAVVLQAFLIDMYTYRLITRAHANAMISAYQKNSYRRNYDTVVQKMNGRDRMIPVVSFLRSYGLSSEDLRLRSRVWPDEYMRLHVGAGTAPSVMAGEAGLLQGVGNALQQLQGLGDKVKGIRDKLDNITNRPPGGK